LTRQRRAHVLPVYPGNTAAVRKGIHLPCTNSSLEGMRHLFRRAVEIAFEHAPAASGSDPQRSLTYHSRAVAGREQTFTAERHKVLPRVSETHNRNPCLATVMRDPDAKDKVAAFHRIAHASVG